MRNNENFVKFENILDARCANSSVGGWQNKSSVGNPECVGSKRVVKKLILI